MYQFSKRRKNSQIKRIGSKGFPEGLNTVAHSSTLKDTELAELINGIYSQYGSISKRQGTAVLGSESENATKILNLAATYKVGDVDRFIKLSDSGIPEYRNFSTGVWTALSGTAPVGYTGTTPTFTGGVPTFDTSVFTNIIQLQNKIFFANSEDVLVWFDEDGWHVFNELENPTTKLSIAKTGTGTGSVTYFYAYVDYNEAGGTLASPEGDPDSDADGTGYKASMPKFLNDDTYLTITLPAAPVGCVKRALFKGYTEGNLFYLDDLAPNETTYTDKGSLVESDEFLTPTVNTTGGQHFYLLEAFEDSLIGTCKEFGRDMLVWSAGINAGEDKSTSFGLPDGGGFYPYNQGDGTYINAIKSFSASNENCFFVFKDSRFGKFRFTNEGGTIQDINVAIGSISPKSPHVAGNNLRFWSQEGAASVGNEANYGTILRYSVLSTKADEIVQSITPANIPQISGAFFKHLSMFGISTDTKEGGNNSILAFDERYNSWSLWTGVYPNVFCKFINPVTKEEKLYYGSSKDGYVLEMFNGKTDYRTSTGTGNKITLSITTKQYDDGLPDQFKKYDKATIVFGSLFGNNTTVGVIKADHRGIKNDPRLRITSDPVLSGFGSDEWNNQEFGEMSEDSGGDNVPIKYVTLKQKDLFWVKINIQNDGIEDEISIIGIYIYLSQSNRPLPFSTKLRYTA